MRSPEAKDVHLETASIHTEELKKLFDVCYSELSPAAFSELQEATDIGQAIQLAITFLAEEGTPDPENFLISHGFVIDIWD